MIPKTHTHTHTHTSKSVLRKRHHQNAAPGHAGAPPPSHTPQLLRTARDVEEGSNAPTHPHLHSPGKGLSIVIWRRGHERSPRPTSQKQEKVERRPVEKIRTSNMEGEKPEKREHQKVSPNARWQPRGKGTFKKFADFITFSKNQQKPHPPEPTPIKATQNTIASVSGSKKRASRERAPTCT